MDEADRPPSAVPAPVWRWIRNELGEWGSRRLDPIVGVVLAAARVAKRGAAISTPPEVLRHWAWFLDGARRQVHQNEREFVMHARATGWPDDEIRRWALLDPGTDLDQHLADLGALVDRTERPPPPG